MHPWQQSQKHKPGHDGRPNQTFLHITQQGGETPAWPPVPCLCLCEPSPLGSRPLVTPTGREGYNTHEGPPRRLPLLHGLHVAVSRLRRRPQREEAAGRPLFLLLLLLLLGHRHDHGSDRFLRRWCRRDREGEGRRCRGRAGVAGARGGRGVQADEGDQEPVPDVRRRRRRRGGEGDGDRVPDGRAARGAHRLGRPQQGRRHGHGERLLPALLPLPPPARDGHGPGGARVGLIGWLLQLQLRLQTCQNLRLSVVVAVAGKIH